MTRYAARLRQLEQKLAPPERARYISLHIEEPGSQPAPDWARAVIEPYTDGGACVIWRGKAGDAAYFACVNGGTVADIVSGQTQDRWYRVTEAGAERIERPTLLTVEFTDDLPDEGTLMPLPVAQRVEAPVDNKPRAESRSKPRVRRRQYRGPE